MRALPALRLPVQPRLRAAVPVRAGAAHEHLLKGRRVVHWQYQVIPDADCIEVTGSHIGLVFNRKVYHAVAGALAQAELLPSDGYPQP